MEAVNGESLAQSINIEQQINNKKITLNENDCLAAINLSKSKNSWKLNTSTTDLMQYENNKATAAAVELIYNNKYNNANNKKSYEKEEEEESEKEHMNNESKHDSDTEEFAKNSRIFDSNNSVINKERTNNIILHKIVDDNNSDKIIEEKINEENCLNQIINEKIQQNHKNAAEQFNNCENLLDPHIDNDEPKNSTASEKEVETANIEILENNLNSVDINEKKENVIEHNNLLNNVPTSIDDEEKETRVKEVEHKENEMEVPVESTVATTQKRSRCSSISSIVSNYSTSSGNTPNLVIDHLVAAAAAQQFSKRKVSSWSSSSDAEAEEPTAKQPHLDCSSSSASSSSEEEQEDTTKNCNAVVQQQSPLKIKIVQNTTPVEQQACHDESAVIDESRSGHETAMDIEQGDKSVNNCSNNNNNEVEQQPQHITPIASSPLKNSAADFVENQLETNTTTTTNLSVLPSPVAALPSAPIPLTIKKNNSKIRYYKCASCATLHESWNFFMHIYKKHQRYICLYCIRIFTTAEKLSVHLEIKHDLEQDHFNSEEALRHYEHVECQGKYLMCCTCQHMFLDEEPFSNHDCNMYMQPCVLCGQMGRHSNNCKAHPDATRRNNKIKAKPPPISNRQQANSILNAKEAVTDCDKVVATTMETLEKSNENTHLTQIATINYNLPENLFNPPPQQQQHHYYQEQNEIQQQQQQHQTYLNQQQEKEEEEEQLGEEEEEVEQLGEEEKEEIPPKLVVPKFKLRVPKEFQKSVDAVITSSEESENESDNMSTASEEEEEVDKTAPMAQDNVQTNQEQKEIELDLDVSDSVDSPAENCLNKSMDSDLDTTEKIKLYKEEWEQRLKDSVNDMKLLNSQQKAQQQEQESVNETTVNGTAHAQWTPTPPASPKNNMTITQQENTTTNEL